MHASNVIRWVLPVFLASLWVGCNRQPSTVDSEPSQEAEVILARADLADGTEDQVVSKCLTCSLGMAGNPAYAAHYGPYELHLCSQTCKKHFEANPEQAILKLKLPVPGE